MTYRVIAAILSAAGLAVLAFLLVAGWSIDRGFFRYLAAMDESRLERLSDELGKRYEEHNGWSFLDREEPDDPLKRVIPSPVRDGGPGRGAEGALPPRRHPFGSMPAPDPERDKNRSVPPAGMRLHGIPPPGVLPPGAGDPLVILDAAKNPVYGASPGSGEVSYRPVIVGGRTIGYVGLRSPRHFLHPMQVEFLARQRLYLALAAAGMVLVVILLSFPLARRLIRPLREMAEAAREIAQGRYAARVSAASAASSDELGQLARAFNGMAMTLGKNETARRQWVADISHELRTPVSILQGEIEALQDGVRAVTPESIQSLHAETIRLKRLIDDLYQLSLSDIGALAYRKANLDIIGTLNDALAACRNGFERKGIAVTPRVAGNANATVFADRERIGQLFINILDNSLSCTDPGGELRVAATVLEGKVVMEFQDSAPGVPEEALPKLFERLYRVDASRSRLSGGAGLGLAICRNIVDAHAGTISAHPSPLGGLLIRITLPVSGGLP